MEDRSSIVHSGNRTDKSSRSAGFFLVDSTKFSKTASVWSFGPLSQIDIAVILPTTGIDITRVKKWSNRQGVVLIIVEKQKTINRVSNTTNSCCVNDEARSLEKIMKNKLITACVFGFMLLCLLLVLYAAESIRVGVTSESVSIGFFEAANRRPQKEARKEFRWM